MSTIDNINLPQLIVALDSLDDDANYVHIKDIRDEVTYYCPCCKGEVKPRAYKSDKDYKMQPHFYHVSGGCTEESYIHYICKNFLFKPGSKFIIDEIIYEVESVFIEKRHETSFGIYIPDITVNTTEGKVIFFEIKNTNKKNLDYAPKWDELSNDVVEVDVKYLVNQKFSDTLPVFKLIYSDGICYIKKYTRRDYDRIAQRKLEWKRQDKLNYKMKWEKLDWFWFELQKYKASKISEEKVIESFSNLEFEDMDLGIKVIKNHKYNSLLNKCAEINNLKFEKLIADLGITIKHLSQMKHEISFPEVEYCGVHYYPTFEYRKKMDICTYSCLCLLLDNQKKVIEIINKEIKEKIIELKNRLKKLNITDVIYKDLSGSYYDKKYNYYAKSLSEIIRKRFYYDRQDEYDKKLNDFKEYVNKHNGWFFDYEIKMKSCYTYMALECVLKFNGRNDCVYRTYITENTSPENIIPEIKEYYEGYHMEYMIRFDGYKRTNWYTNKIYCEKDRLMVVKEDN